MPPRKVNVTRSWMQRIRNVKNCKEASPEALAKTEDWCSTPLWRTVAQAKNSSEHHLLQRHASGPQQHGEICEANCEGTRLGGPRPVFRSLLEEVVCHAGGRATRATDAPSGSWQAFTDAVASPSLLVGKVRRRWQAVSVPIAPGEERGRAATNDRQAPHRRRRSNGNKKMQCAGGER